MSLSALKGVGLVDQKYPASPAVAGVEVIAAAGGASASPAPAAPKAPIEEQAVVAAVDAYVAAALRYTYAESSAEAVQAEHADLLKTPQALEMISEKLVAAQYNSVFEIAKKHNVLTDEVKEQLEARDAVREFFNLLNAQGIDKAFEHFNAPENAILRGQIAIQMITKQLIDADDATRLKAVLAKIDPKFRPTCVSDSDKIQMKRTQVEVLVYTATKGYMCAFDALLYNAEKLDAREVVSCDELGKLNFGRNVLHILIDQWKEEAAHSYLRRCKDRLPDDRYQAVIHLNAKGKGTPIELAYATGYPSIVDRLSDESGTITSDLLNKMIINGDQVAFDQALTMLQIRNRQPVVTDTMINSAHDKPYFLHRLIPFFSKDQVLQYPKYSNWNWLHQFALSGDDRGALLLIRVAKKFGVCGELLNQEGKLLILDGSSTETLWLSPLQVAVRYNSYKVAQIFMDNTTGEINGTLAGLHCCLRDGTLKLVTHETQVMDYQIAPDAPRPVAVPQQKENSAKDRDELPLSEDESKLRALEQEKQSVVAEVAGLKEDIRRETEKLKTLNELVKREQEQKSQNVVRIRELEANVAEKEKSIRGKSAELRAEQEKNKEKEAAVAKLQAAEAQSRQALQGAEQRMTELTRLRQVDAGELGALRATNDRLVQEKASVKDQLTESIQQNKRMDETIKGLRHDFQLERNEWQANMRRMVQEQVAEATAPLRGEIRVLGQALEAQIQKADAAAREIFNLGRKNVELQSQVDKLSKENADLKANEDAVVVEVAAPAAPAAAPGK